MTRHLLVVGAQRCGTTYLHDLLAAHPEIAMARPARPEPKVFLSDDVAGRGRNWYLDTYFAHATDERLLGEKSTSYLESAEAATRAAAMLGDPLIVVQLRDPVQRAISNWAFSSDSGLETRTVAEALSANLEGTLSWDPDQTSVSPFAYLERGRYADYLGPWTAHFGDDVKIVFLEELRSGAEAVGELYASLGVDPGVRPPSLGVPVNESRANADLDPDLRARLRDHFRDADEKLAEILGRELPWRAPAPTTKETQQ